MFDLNNILFSNRNTYTKIHVYIVFKTGSDSKHNAYMKVISCIIR